MAALAFEQDASEDVHIAAALEPLGLGERRGEEFVALRHAFAVGAVAGGAEKKAGHEFPGNPAIESCRQC